MPLKIKIPKNREIINIPKDFITLEEVTKNGFFVYKIKYELDPSHPFFRRRRRSKRVPSNVRITIIEDDTPEQKIKIFSPDLEIKDISRSLRLNASRQRDLRRNNKEYNTIFSSLSDFTKVLPNNLTSLLTSKRRRTLDRDDKVVVRRRHVVKSISVSDLKNRNERHPKLGVNKARPRPNRRTHKAKYSKRKIRQHKRDLLFKSKIDPAALFGEKTPSIITAKKSFAGLGPNKHSFGKASRKSRKHIRKNNQINKLNHSEKKLLKNKQNRAKKLSRYYFSKMAKRLNAPIHKFKKEDILKSLALLNETDSTDTEKASSEDSVSVIHLQEDTFLTVEEVLQIPVGKLGYDNFTVVFEVIGGNGFIFQVEKEIVQHEQNTLNVEIPSLAPDINVPDINRPGKILLELTQNDENATEIQLYRKALPIDRPIIDAQYDLVGTVKIEKDDHPAIFQDEHYSINPMLYRALAVNSNGVVAGDFASAVVTQERAAVARKLSLLRRPNSVTFTHKLVKNIIELTVSNIPPEPIALKIQKRDLTLHETDWTNVLNPTLLLDNGNTPIIIQDEDLKSFRIYEYRVVLIHEDGFESQANNAIITEYCPIENNIINLEVSKPTFDIQGQDVDVVFEIEKEIVNKDMDLIKSLLIEQGNIAEFEDDIKNNREKLQELFFIRVVRTNLLTGEEDDFGIIDDSTFSDLKFGKKRKIPSPEEGLKYQYAVFAHARTPESLIETVEQTVSGSVELNGKVRNYSFKPSKWRHPTTLRTGNLVTAKSIQKNHSKTQFTLGPMADVEYVEVNLQKALPSISSVKSFKLTDTSALVRWKIDGDIDKIDHFLITLQLSGNKTIVGKCHNISRSGEFQFVDILDNEETGRLIYGVSPVFYDYESGVEKISNAIII